MNTKKVSLGLAAASVALVLAGCWGGSPVSDHRPATPAASASASPACALSCQDVPQAVQTGPASMAADPGTEKAAVSAAVKVMAAYLDGSKPKEQWFQALAPMLTTAYAQDAQYIQPSRLPVRKLTKAPAVVPMPVQDGHQVRVKFGTNAGEWLVIMTRSSAGAPWLASNVVPAQDAQ